VMGGWMLRELATFAIAVLGNIPQVAR
jgi:hypothetical protein